MGRAAAQATAEEVLQKAELTMLQRFVIMYSQYNYIYTGMGIYFRVPFQSIPFSVDKGSPMGGAWGTHGNGAAIPSLAYMRQFKWLRTEHHDRQL